jgi:Carboxypeptidase regulatory-like domain
VKRRSIYLYFLLFVLLIFAPCRDLFGQTPTGSIHGQVTDPAGAVVPNASVTVLNTNGQTAGSATSSGTGSYEVHGLAPGTYTIQATAQGFAVYSSKSFTIAPGQSRQRDIALTIQSDQQQVVVSDEAVGVSTESSNNASAIVIKGKDLDALSDDPDEMQDELTALAGPAAGPNGGQIYIDGFSGGQLPPKSAIREIRVNQNPFSPEYDKLGMGRIEILTKPGTDKLHGFIMATGNNSSFNSTNTFLTTRPDYYSYFLNGNAGGSLNKNASWFVSVFRRSAQNVNVVNATVAADAGGNATTQLVQAVSSPQTRLDINPRLDFQLGQANTLTVRYGFNRTTAESQGVGQLKLAEQAYNTESIGNTLQISDTQVLSPRIVNETRFEYYRERSSQLAQFHTPTIVVSGLFTGGGSNSGDSRSNEDFFELQNYTTASLGNHSLRFGTRLRLNRQSAYNTAGANGQYTYTDPLDENQPSALQNYLADSAAGTFTHFSQYKITNINRATERATLFDGALFIGDDWHVNPRFTLSYGLRYENQNHLQNHLNFAPRVSFAWALDGNGKGPAKTVLRAGYGWFYDRFDVSYVLQSILLNGFNQTYSVITPGSNGQNRAATIYSIAPHLHAPVNMQAAVTVDRQISKIATVSVTYVNSRGVHSLLTDNISAIGNPDAAALPQNIYQYQSGGVYKQNQLLVNFRVGSRRVSAFGFYAFSRANADTSGAGYFPSNQANPSADYGRASFNTENNFLLGGSWVLPYKFTLSPFINAKSGNPYNIVAQRDLNNDNQFNDRPSFATCGSPQDNSGDTYKGHCFNVNPGVNDPRIPINYGDAPSQFGVNLRVSKAIGIGPKVEGGSGAASHGGGMGGPGGGGRHGGGFGGGLGPGGLGGNAGGPPRLDATVPRRYSLTFVATGRNIFNTVNLAQPNGVVGASTFGKSTALAGGFFAGASGSNRSVDLQMSFNF